MDEKKEVDNFRLSRQETDETEAEIIIEKKIRKYSPPSFEKFSENDPIDTRERTASDSNICCCDSVCACDSVDTEGCSCHDVCGCDSVCTSDCSCDSHSCGCNSQGYTYYSYTYRTYYY